MTETELDRFSILTVEDAQRFDERLRTWAQSESKYVGLHLSMEEVFQDLAVREDHKKLFAAFLDLYLSWIFCGLDFMECGGLSNQLSRSGLISTSILDSQQVFNLRMSSLHFHVGYVLRLRAVWDKLMGFIVLLAAPYEYEKFAKAKSRRGAFKKIIKTHPHFPKDLAESIERIISEIDDKFRTAEAHGTGSLRIYLLAKNTPMESPELRLLVHYNLVNGLFAKLGSIIKSAHLYPSKLSFKATK